MHTIKLTDIHIHIELIQAKLPMSYPSVRRPQAYLDQASPIPNVAQTDHAVFSTFRPLVHFMPLYLMRTLSHISHIISDVFMRSLLLLARFV